MTVNIKKVSDNAILPKYQTEGSAGCDLYACIKAPLTINPQQTVVIPTGLAIATPINTVAMIFARSGLGIKHGIAPANKVGVIDSDYRGEILVGLHNSSNTPYEVSVNERIAQLVIMPYIKADFLEVQQLEDSDRNTGGFGSTGKV